MSNRRERFDEAADKVLLSTDERASLLVLHADEYLNWLKDGRGLEIRPRRLAEITGALVLLSKVFSPREAHDWLLSRETVMAPRIPAAVLRVGNVEDVSNILRNWSARGIDPVFEGGTRNSLSGTGSQSIQPSRLLALLRQVGMTDHEIAVTVGADQEAIEGCATGHLALDKQVVTRLGKLGLIVERIGRVVKPAAIAPWMRTSVPALGGLKPIEVMGQGRYIEVERVIASLEGTIAT